SAAISRKRKPSSCAPKRAPSAASRPRSATSARSWPGFESGLSNLVPEGFGGRANSVELQAERGRHLACQRCAEGVDGSREFAAPVGEGALRFGMVFRGVDEIGVPRGQLDERNAEIPCQFDPPVVLVENAVRVPAQGIAMPRSELRDGACPAELVKAARENAGVR